MVGSSSRLILILSTRDTRSRSASARDCSSRSLDRRSLRLTAHSGAGTYSEARGVHSRKLTVSIGGTPVRWKRDNIVGFLFIHLIAALAVFPWFFSWTGVAL